LSDQNKQITKNSSKQKIKLHDLMEYERSFYQDIIERKASCRTCIEVNWQEGGASFVEVTRKERVK